MLLQLVVRPMSQLPPAWPSQRGTFTVVKTRSMELFTTLLETLAVTPTGREPTTKPPAPVLLPYLINGNWPSCGVASAILTVTLPLTANAPATFNGAKDGLPKLPRSKLSDVAVDVPNVRLAALSWLFKAPTTPTARAALFATV